MKRHPRISLRRPEATSLNRINAFNKADVKVFYDNLKDIQNKHHIQPDKIFNVDETSISTVQKNSKILAERGEKQVGKATSAERGSTTTVVCAISAAGQYIPPFFIFKRKRMNALLLKGSNPNMVASVSDSGWINDSLFIDWLQHFISYAKPSLTNQVLLILDNHESHISLGAYNLCRDNGIIMLTLPPHTSHKLQPLDLTFFGPLKSAYYQECENYMSDRLGKPITQYEIVELFTNAFNRCSNLEKAASGFKSAGIYPYRPVDIDTIQPYCSQNTSFQITRTQTQNSAINNQVSDNQIANDSIVEVATIEQQAPVLQNLVPDPQNLISQDCSEQVSLSDIVELPVMSPKIYKRNIRKKKSIILTSTPIKDRLEEKENKKRQRESKDTEKKSKKQAETKRRKREDENRKETRKVRKNLKNIGDFGHLEEKYKKTEKEKNKNDEYFCIFCNEKYNNSETWIMCHVCKNWAHELCTDQQSTSTGYKCDLCRT
ncbi:uncharacterized protein LOC115452978 [Manduca sexta]|uniref:uncharacterized protein LOC115452978 n=1 Tax=Manduca sexta TaxID=7130 RepID=UPI00188E34C5|nr:uncharacterized protein LOC115452978 [Manduca sexta]